MGTFITKTRNSTLYSNLGLYASETPEILSILACILEKTIQRNDKLIKKSRSKDNVTIFHGTRAPTLSIRRYIGRVFEYSSCSPSCFVVAYIYMDRFVKQSGCYVTSLNVHRLLLACVLVAVKFLEDECHNNAYFAKIGGVSCAEINRLELKLLLTLNYNCHVSLETFDQYCQWMEAEGESGIGRRTSLPLKWTVRSCGLRGSWLKKDRQRQESKYNGY